MPTLGHSTRTFTGVRGRLRHFVCRKRESEKNGIRNAKKTVETQGLQLFHGKLLPGLLSCHGVKRTPHGGVAILAPKDFGTEFDPNSDQSGLYLKILETKRAHAVWVQVSKNLKVLVINIYCRTGASQDRVVQQTNNDLLQDLFTFACQFGSIPVIIAGDFQLPPLQYDAVSQAVNFHQWNDSLAVTEEPGIFRPLTYSADGTFTGPGDGCSSIHGVLTNATASAALFRAEVLPLLKVQHRPIQVTFKWDHLWQRGFILYKTAPLCLRGLNQHVQPDSSLNHIEQCHDLTIDECWSRANHIAIDALLAQGASWGPGPRQRGEAVQTKSKVICPGQHPNGCAVTKRSSWLHKEASEKSSFFILPHSLQDLERLSSKEQSRRPGTGCFGSKPLVSGHGTNNPACSRPSKLFSGFKMPLRWTKLKF